MLFKIEVESDMMSSTREGVSELELIGNGCVMAIGGNEDKRAARTSILAAFVERAGGAAARIVIVPSASVAPRERAQRYTKIFSRLGVTEIRAVHPESGVTKAS